MKQHSLTIAVIAHNEAGTIEQVLKDIYRQVIPSWVTIKEILVVSDGSTDATIRNIKRASYKKVRILVGKKQMGKNVRLNELFAAVSTDFLVLVDADVRFANSSGINHLLAPLKNTSIGLSAGNPQPIQGSSLTERAANNWTRALIDVRGKIRSGNNPYCVCGPLLALSRSFYKNVRIPSKLPSDRYLYFACKHSGFSFAYAPHAIVWFRSAQTVQDHIAQSRRYHWDFVNLTNALGAKTVQKEFYIPFMLRIRLIISQIIHDPIAYIVMKYLHMKVISSQNPVSTNKWKSVPSTKRLALDI